MNNLTKKAWYIIPQLILDREKYRGKGRPRKSDYRMYPADSDYVKVPQTYVVVKDAKNWIGSIGDA